MYRGFHARRWGWWLSVVLTFAGLFVEPRNVGAQNPDQKPSASFGVALTGAGGLFTYVKDRPGILHVNVINRKDVPLEILATTYFQDEPTLQYGRKIWLPPRSRLQTWHPIKIPSQVGGDGKTVRFESLFLDASDGREVLIKTESGQMKHDGFLQVMQEAVTGFIDSRDGVQRPQTDEALELVAACRLQYKLSRRVTSVTDLVFDPGDESLAPLDHLVVSDSRPLHDAAGIASIRRWLHAGGRLWVMLDQVEPELLTTLLGDEMPLEVVDRLSLTSVEVEPGPAGPRGTRSSGEFERPVDFVRTMVDGVNVAFTVNGWPAAFWKTCGEGQLLVTTLGPRGWMELRKPRPPGEAPPPAALDLNPTRHQPMDPMIQLGSQFFAPRKPALVKSASLQPIVEQYVGYSIPSRGLIIGLLAGFTGVLMLTGVCLWRMGKLEWMGAAGPVLAVIVSLLLVSVGHQQRQAVPPTAASLQFVRPISGTDDFTAEGAVGIFSPESGTAHLGAQNGGWIAPQMSGSEGTTRRMVWTDLNQWEWHNLPAVAGLRPAEFQISGELPTAVSATATFGPQGLTGKVDLGEGRTAEDALLATADGRIGARIQPTGELQVLAADVFSPEQFMAADLLSDEQNRRRSMLQQVLTNPKRNDYPEVPTLFLWTKAWDLGFEFDADSRLLGSALVALPLRLQRPDQDGTEVVIPAPLLSFKPIVGPDGVVPSGLYDPRGRVWAEKSWPSAIWLRFQIPPEVLPVEVTGGKLVVRVRGPMGKLTLSTAQNQQVSALKTWMDPVGTLEHDLNDTGLTVDAEGGVLLKLDAGDPDRPELTKTVSADGEKTNYWQVESLGLQLRARTVPAQPGR